MSSQEWGVCRYCGGRDDIIDRRSGQPGRVCRPCRNTRAAEERRMPMAAPVRSGPRKRYHNPRMTTEERGRRIQSALEIANAKGITLVQALTIEGVI